MRLWFAALIAYRQVTAHPRRFVAGVAGLCAAIVLMMVQVGIREGLYGSAVRLHRSLDGDIVLVSPDFVSLTNKPSFSEEYLFRAESIPGVLYARPLYADVILWRNPSTGIPRSIYIFGFNPSEPVFDIPAVTRDLGALRDGEAVLFDKLSRAEFGPIVSGFMKGHDIQIDLAIDQRPNDPLIHVAGIFELGPSFVIDGNVVTSDRNFHRITNVSLDRVTFGVVKTSGEFTTKAMVERLQGYLGSGIKVLSKEDLIGTEKSFWANNTAIGFVFDTGLAIGAFVGIIFIYQVLYTITNENIREYAILKSLGYKIRFLRLIILIAAVFIGACAIVPGVTVGFAVVGAARMITLLDLQVKDHELAVLCCAAVMMSVFAGWFAAQRLRLVDPVELFN